jgi:HlyD family secretion protein
VKNVKSPHPLLSLGLLALVLSGCGAPEIETLHPKRGEIEESFLEPARTRLSRTYPITMPTAGRIESISLRPGDRVQKGQRLVAFDTLPTDQEIRRLEAQKLRLEAELLKVKDNQLEETLREGALRELAASRQALKASQAQDEAESLRAKQLEVDLARDEKLLSQKAITRERLERVRLDAHTARIDWRRQGFFTAAMRALDTAVQLGPQIVDRWISRKDHDLAILKHQLTEVDALLLQSHNLRKQQELRSPIDGVVLAREHPGGTTLPAGAGLLTLGKLVDLEVLAEVLSRDALRLRPGTPVLLEGKFPAKIQTLEPLGFTKFSSLGVEQQRVRVRILPEQTLPGIGPGYRLEARFRIRHKAAALVLPRHAVLQNQDRSSFVFLLAGGQLRKTPITLGLTSDLQVEVAKGLSEKDLVVRFPDVSMKEGDPGSQASYP